MNNQHLSSIKFLVLADSQARDIDSVVVTSSYNLIVKSISGLKWKHDNDPERSLYALLSLPDMKSFLLEASAVLFLVGTNSVRMIPANKIISQVQQVILFVQEKYPHLNQPEKISISLTFPCFKTNRRFPTPSSLTSNINLYNEKLKVLASQINFNILDLHITKHHLTYDNMHVHSRFANFLLNSIINHFNPLIPPPLTTSTTSNSTPSTTSNSTPSTTSATSNSTSAEPKASQSFFRSQEALQCRNEKNYRKMKAKQQQHLIKRKIYHKWTVPQIKKFLDSLHIKYDRIPHIYHSTLRLPFNNQDDQDFANSKLGIDIFNEDHYKIFVNNHPS